MRKVAKFSPNLQLKSRETAKDTNFIQKYPCEYNFIGLNDKKYFQKIFNLEIANVVARKKKKFKCF